MGLAPNLDELRKSKNASKEATPKTNERSGEKVMAENVSPMSSKDYSDELPTIHIFGAGGAGKVAAIRYLKSTDHQVPITTIDTSGLEEEIPGIASIRIKNLSGSGKYRRENVDPITNFITDYTSKNEFAQVNIIIASFSGGSGSIVSPLLVDEILRQGKIAVVFGILDTDSEIDTTNAMNCLRTFDNLVTNREAYLPMMLFDNNFGRAVVDTGINTMLQNVMAVMHTPYIGLDVQDRIKFLNPIVFDGVEQGIKLFNISTKPDGDWETTLGLIVPEDSHEKLDATVVISNIDAVVKLAKRCTVTFRGYHETDNGHIIAAIGYQIPEDLIKKLNADIHAYKSTVDKPKTQIKSEYEIGQTTKGGLVL